MNKMGKMPSVLLGPQISTQFGRSIDSLGTLPTVSGGGGGGAAFTPPLWLSGVDTSNVIVSSGTVSGILVSGVATNIDVSGTDGTWSIYVGVTLNGSGDVTSAAIGTDPTGAVPVDDSTDSYRLVGNVTVVSGKITVVTPAMAWSQEFIACTAGDPTSYHWVVS